MKAFYIVLLLVFITSCGSNAIIEDVPEEVTIKTTQELDEAIQELPEEIIEEWNRWNQDTKIASESKVVELSTKYVNPAWEVDVNIEYKLAADYTIASISVTSPNYAGMNRYNNTLQDVIWMSIQEASEYYISGSSLFTPVFQKAMKLSL
jgi:hypothetical protein